MNSRHVLPAKELTFPKCAGPMTPTESTLFGLFVNERVEFVDAKVANGPATFVHHHLLHVQWPSPAKPTPLVSELLLHVVLGFSLGDLAVDPAR
jgi:hypothetical protein